MWLWRPTFADQCFFTTDEIVVAVMRIAGSATTHLLKAKPPGCLTCGKHEMSDPAPCDPVLDQLRSRLELIYGDAIERLILFGSRARGVAGDESDYDVAVFFKELPDRWEALHRLADLRFQMMAETGAFFDLLPYSAADYVQRTPLMREIRRDGIAL